MTAVTSGAASTSAALMFTVSAARWTVLGTVSTESVGTVEST